ncbi:urease accessory UreF family protein [Actinoplanes sp. NPDC023714]|uniref:urease accessory protein UreF n=1 Tax=Actinoplanes sp. NPDC023714 TaxID=3154322 RepID=UPI0033DCD5A9
MSLATLLLLADGRLPSGGHAHSGGLEAQVAAGRVRDVEGLGGFLRGKLATGGLVSAAFAAAACGDAGRVAAARGDSGRVAAVCGDAGRVAELDAGLDARTPSPALRKASRAQGRALLRAGRVMWPIPASVGRELHQPVALGVVAAAAGLGPGEAAVAAAHATVTGPASAAVRLLGLDPYAVHALLARLTTECDRIAAEAAGRYRDAVDDLPAAGAPLLDIGAEHHATWEVRLFAS